MSRVLPILFNGDMVRAILDGRKTVTRRLIEPQPTYSQCDGFTWKGGAYGTDFPPTIKGASYNFRCAAPYKIGDILYVKEAWSQLSFGYVYKADGENIDHLGNVIKWHPSINMPKEAARIFLCVKDVHVERLQEITEEQAEVEGIRGYSKDGNLYKYAVTDDWWIDYHNKHRKSFLGTWWQDMPRTAKDAFPYLWNSTIKKSDLDRYGWDANPWVWVIEFERCEKPEGWCV